MNENVFQNIFDKISVFFPQGWKTIIYFAGYTEGSYSMKFYIKTDKEGYIDCYNLLGISKAVLIKTFMDIDKILSKERNALEKDKRWTVFTMKVDCTGNMKTEFDYEEHSKDMVAFENDWEKKYLL